MSGRGGSRAFAALRSQLAPASDISHEGVATVRSGVELRLDPGRRVRTGIPEVVLAGAKPPERVLAALRTLADANGRAIASRCEAAHRAAITAAMPSGYRVEIDETASALVLVCEGHPQAEIICSGGRVGVIAAGSSDARAAAEAALMAREMGCATSTTLDVGVAGIHRLVAPLEQILNDGVDAIVVAAGMDGALPSVVAGLVDVPVIGLPTPVGYGYGGGGEAALLSMLQSCAPGLVVVNIDNGIGAGAAAARIANRTALARRGVTDDGPLGH